MMIEEAAGRLGVDLEEMFSLVRRRDLRRRADRAPRSRTRRVVGLELYMQTSLGDVGAATECSRARRLPHVGGLRVHASTSTRRARRRSPTASAVSSSPTTLINKIEPLIRYRSDDLVRLTRKECGCGRTHGRIWPLGRKGDEVLVEGPRCCPATCGRRSRASTRPSAGFSRSSAPHREVDQLRLRVGYATEGPKGLDDLRTRVTDAVHAAVGVQPDVDLVENAVLLRQGPPHKIPRVAKSSDDVRLAYEEMPQGGASGASSPTA